MGEKRHQLVSLCQSVPFFFDRVVSVSKVLDFLVSIEDEYQVTIPSQVVHNGLNIPLDYIGANA
jgi:hypothetical protein